MKIRAPSELTDALDSALAWRKKELTTIHLSISGTPRDHEKALLRRLAVPILYAHWEGFIKQASEFYLEMVARQGLPYEKLQPCFVAIALRRIFSEAQESNKTHSHLAVTEFLLFNQANSAKIAFKNVIDTKSNLNSDVLKNIFETIGIIPDSFWTGNFLLIDGSLLKTRNSIVHGQREEVDDPTYLQLHKFVIAGLDYMRSCVENAATQKRYQR